jgi:hypothetical protein
LPQATGAHQVSVYSPDFDEPRVTKANRNVSTLTFTLREVKTYSIVAVGW